MNQLTRLDQEISSNRATRAFLDGLDRNQMQSLEHEIHAELYWAKRNPHWFIGKTNRDWARLRKVLRAVKKRLLAGRVKPELTSNGAEVTRSTFGFGDASDYHRLFLRDSGWEELTWPGMTSYSTAWVNEETWQICTYCEGDVSIIQARTKAQFLNEFGVLASWYAAEAA